MKDISDLIDFENENSSLDFKAIQYKKDMHESFLKDIMALANAISKEDKYIITGIKHFPDGKREKLGIESNFIDDATYQQLVDVNIEPSISFRYSPYEYEGKLYGVIEITDCSNPPYMMKKNFGNLKLGDSFIRKGSYQNRLTRKDIDLQIKHKSGSDISQKVKISLDDSDIINNSKIPRNIFELPSLIRKKEIQKEIEKKVEMNSPFNDFTMGMPNPYYYTPYEKRSLATLTENLKNVNIDFAEDDEYCLYEKNAYKLNFYIHNDSSNFLEDVFIEIKTKKTENFIIRESIYVKSSSYYPLINISPRSATFEEMNYPAVILKDNEYKISSSIVNVKHKLPTEVLKVPIRIAALTLNEISIEFEIKLFAKNIKEPILEKLQIIIN